MDRPLGADHVVMATAGLKATPTRGKYLFYSLGFARYGVQVCK